MGRLPGHRRHFSWAVAQRDTWLWGTSRRGTPSGAHGWARIERGKVAAGGKFPGLWDVPRGVEMRPRQANRERELGLDRRETG